MTRTARHGVEDEAQSARVATQWNGKVKSLPLRKKGLLGIDPFWTLGETSLADQKAEAKESISRIRGRG
jgi:hypothetical protein